MKLSVQVGKTDVTILVYIQDSSSSSGDGLTGLVYNTSGLTCYYMRPGANPVEISLAAQTVANGNHIEGGFCEIDSTNCPGWYRLDLPDAALASGVISCALHLQGATNMVQCPVEIELTAWDNQDASVGGMAIHTAVGNLAPDTGMTVLTTLRELLAVATGIVSGRSASSNTDITYRDRDGEPLVTISATAAGNRSRS